MLDYLSIYSFLVVERSYQDKFRFK